jgi:hypothetical protein
MARAYLQPLEDAMTYSLPALLYRSAIIKQEIEAERQRVAPDRLRVMRLNAIRLKLMNRLLALFPGRSAHSRAGALLPAF